MRVRTWRLGRTGFPIVLGSIVEVIAANDNRERGEKERGPMEEIGGALYVYRDSHNKTSSLLGNNPDSEVLDIQGKPFRTNFKTRKLAGNFYEISFSSKRWCSSNVLAIVFQKIGGVHGGTPPVGNRVDWKILFDKEAFLSQESR